MSDPADKIFELRFYSVEAHRQADITGRVQNDLKWLFPRHGIRPIGGWNAISAKALPTFIYITPFENMLVRDRSWRGFYSDPDWQEVRNRTNAGSELVEDYEIWFVREIAPWSDAGPTAGLDEIVFLKTLVGKSGAAGKALVESELPAFERAGAHVIAAFDVISGGTLPAAVAFLRWPDFETRRASVEVMAADELLATGRREETAKFGKTLIGRSGSYLLSPVEVDWD